ncbi:unnamed protein product [Paramecium sonneborni]|uniref:Uncharacterized protein n=1 Tax=Paramecium sonneborni TaxID=65129 RepID=A0A8S1QXE8_9CILI|nr:unnamed protein product [Paramecium sonneborni]
MLKREGFLHLMMEKQSFLIVQGQLILLFKEQKNQFSQSQIFVFKSEYLLNSQDDYQIYQQNNRMRQHKISYELKCLYSQILSVIKIMVRSLIWLSLLIMAYSIQVKVEGCTCEEIQKQDQCDDYQPGELDCEWNIQKKACESHPFLRKCYLINDGELCKNQRDCAWVNNKCVDFTKCTDYKETLDQKCYEINRFCVLQKDDKCGPFECDQLSLDFCVYSYYFFEKWCTLSSDRTKCVPMTTCEQSSFNKDECQINYGSCFWDNNKCRNIKCTDIKIEEDCQLNAFSFDWSIATLCHWDGGKCIEAKQDDLTEENCFRASVYGMRWLDGKCQSCQASPNPDPPTPSYHRILSTIISLIVIVMI